MPAPIDSAHFAAIRALILAADAGSLSAAAKKLRLTPSAVSKQVSRLEEAFSARLLERSTRRVRATDAGLALIDRARPLFEAFDDAGAMLAGLQNEVQGRVRLSASRALGRLCLLEPLARLAAEHPRLEVELLLDARRLDFVEDGIDVAVREGQLPDSSLTVRRLGNVGVGLFASADYLARRGTPRSLDDLVAHELLALPASRPELDLARLRGRGGSRLELRPRVVVNDLLALAELAERGGGIAPLPTYVARDGVERGALRRVLPKATLATIPVQLVWLSRRHLPERVRVVLERLRDELPPALGI